MDKVGLSIQSKLPKLITKMISNPENVEMFFNAKSNPFLLDYASSKRFLAKKVQHNIELIEKFKNTEDEVTKAYIKSRKNELDYMLFCNYALELGRGDEIFSTSVPFKDVINKYVYEHRAENFEKYKSMIEFYVNQIEKNDIYIKSNLPIADWLKNYKFSKPNAKYLFGKSLQDKLAYEIKKMPLTPKPYHYELDGYDYYQKLYIGEHRKKPVLLAEVVKVGKKDKKTKKQEFSYEFSLVLNGNLKKRALLYRMDYNSKVEHANRLAKGQNLNCKNAILGSKDCHIHIPNTNFAVMFPNRIHQSDAKEYDLKFSSLNKFLEFNHNLIKAEDEKILLDDEQIKKIKQAKTLTLDDITKKDNSKTL